MVSFFIGDRREPFEERYPAMCPTLQNCTTDSELTIIQTRRNYEISMFKFQSTERIQRHAHPPNICVKFASTEKIMLNHGSIKNSKIVRQSCFLSTFRIT